jgi:hypothetical protein
MQEARSGWIVFLFYHAILTRAILRMSPERMARRRRPDHHSSDCQEDVDVSQVCVQAISHRFSSLENSASYQYFLLKDVLVLDLSTNLKISRAPIV